jgi:hypothetical protein
MAIPWDNGVRGRGWGRGLLVGACRVRCGHSSDCRRVARPVNAARRAAPNQNCGTP